MPGLLGILGRIRPGEPRYVAGGGTLKAYGTRDQVPHDPLVSVTAQTLLSVPRA